MADGSIRFRGDILNQMQLVIQVILYFVLA